MSEVEETTVLETYTEAQTRIKEEQSGMSRDQIMDLMTEQSEYALDLDSLQTTHVAHKWKDRGMFLSCEGAGHTSHRHAKQ